MNKEAVGESEEIKREGKKETMSGRWQKVGIY